MKTLTPKAHRMRKTLVKDNAAYIDSVSKRDLETLEAVLDTPDGKGTVVRAHMDATTQMPLRALTFLLAAGRICELLPVEQLQIVTHTQTGRRANGLSQRETRDQFDLLIKFGQRLLSSVVPGVAHKTVFAEDALPPVIGRIEAIAADRFKGELALAQPVEQRGRRLSGNPIAFAAANTLIKDTVFFTPRPLRDVRELVETERVVNIGPLGEKSLFGMRQAIKSALPAEDLMPTVQIFTRHAVSPTSLRNDTELSLEAAFVLRQFCFETQVISTQRDLRHFQEPIEAAGMPKL